MENPAIVIDIGSGICKSGFAGDDSHRSVVPTLIAGLQEKQIGNDALLWQREELNIKYPIENGVVKDWDDFESIFDYIFVNELRINSEEHSLLTTEAILNPRDQRERMTEMFFEKFNVPSLFIAFQGLLSLISSGRTTGIVLDCGEGVTQVTPFFEGNIQLNAIKRSDFAGKKLTEYLQKTLNAGNELNISNCTFEAAKLIKENLCFVSTESSKVNDNSLLEKSYKLPDGKIINITNERHKCPELLFKPVLGDSAHYHDYPGIHELLYDSIMKCDNHLVDSMFTNILINGGSTMFPGFTERINKEIKALKLESTSGKMKVIAPPERKSSVWIGGSILASLESFQQFLLSKQEYNEYGSSLSHRHLNILKYLVSEKLII